MTRLSSRKTKSIPMRIGNDPALWRFTNMQQALESNTDLIAWSIHIIMEYSTIDDCKVEAEVVVPTAKGLKISN
jgi:hypothetical protein